MVIGKDIIIAAQKSHAAFYPLGPFASISLAQWALESDWGRHLSGENNYFGIKATREEIAAGKARIRWTHETSNGVYHPIMQAFANYANLDDCFLAHARLLTYSTYYWKAREAITPDEYAMALEGIYATGIPGYSYGGILIEIMKENDLYQYDAIMQQKEPANVN